MNPTGEYPTDEQAADEMGAKHPKAKAAPVHPHFAPVLPGSPGSGAAPGANGPPTTSSVGGPVYST